MDFFWRGDIDTFESDLPAKPTFFEVKVRKYEFEFNYLKSKQTFSLFFKYKLLPFDYVYLNLLAWLDDRRIKNFMPYV